MHTLQVEQQVGLPKAQPTQILPHVDSAYCLSLAIICMLCSSLIHCLTRCCATGVCPSEVFSCSLCKAGFELPVFCLRVYPLQMPLAAIMTLVCGYLRGYGPSNLSMHDTWTWVAVLPCPA